MKTNTETRGRPIAHTLTPGLRLAVDAAGGSLSSLARLLGISTQAVAQWKEVPIQQVFEVERTTRISRKRLRPDIFAVPPLAGCK